MSKQTPSARQPTGSRATRQQQWEQRRRTSALGYTADATHTLTFVTFDGNGHKTVVTGNPLNIKFSEHETIYILYNSPNVTPQPFTKFLPGE